MNQTNDLIAETVDEFGLLVVTGQRGRMKVDRRGMSEWDGKENSDQFSDEIDVLPMHGNNSPNSIFLIHYCLEHLTFFTGSSVISPRTQRGEKKGAEPRSGSIHTSTFEARK